MCTGAEWTSRYDGYPCPNTIVEVPVTVDMESGDWNWINGLIVVPATHAVDVPLDKSVEVFSSTILVDTYVANGAAYEVLNTGGSNCVSTLSVSSGAAGELARMIERVLTFSVAGSEGGLDYASGAPTECTAVVRLVDDTSRNETISFTISPKRGEPSSLSLVGDVTATASSPAQFTFQPRDRLGNLCDRQWEGVRFTLTAVASDGSQYPLLGSSSATNSLEHVLSVQSLELGSGSDSLQGYLLLPNRTETVRLTDVAALSVSPVSCQAGETSVGGGQSCVCAAGYYAAGGTCSPCEADTCKEGAGDALSCTPCPDGGATAGTGATSSSDCTCPTNSELNSAGNACECAAGYYGSGRACAVCGAGTYKGSAGNALGCTSCPAGASTGVTGSTSFSDCACPTDSELNSAGDACECIVGYFGSGGSCTACGLGSYEVDAGDALGCVPCPGGATTTFQAALSVDNCTAPLNTELDESGQKYICLAGFSGSGSSGTCSACALNTFKSGAGNAVECNGCPTGATTVSTGSTASSDCTCRANSELSSAGDACECVAGYYGSGGVCTACGAGTFKGSKGDALGCTSCPAGATTLFQGALSAYNCTAPANTELDGSGQKYICLAGFSGSGSSGTCSACALNTFKSRAGDAIDCTPCPVGGTTVSTGSISSSECTCRANSELNSAEGACECVAGYYGSGGACTACELGTFKQGLGDAPGCTSCSTGASTVSSRGRGSGVGGGDGQRGFEQAVSSIVIGLSAVLLAWCLALVIQDITGIRLLGRGASHGARGGGGAAEVLDPLAAGGGGGGGKAGAAPRGSSARLPGPARPQTGEPVWFGDAWDAAPSAGGGDVHEVANPVAAAQKPGAGGASGVPGARGRPPAVVTPNPLLGGRLSNAQDLARGRGEGGGASPWVRYLAYDGHYEYFHNTATGEVSWERPPDFREEALSPPRF